MEFKQYLWPLPFCSFLLGYYVIQHIFRAEEQATPNLVGKSLHEAITLLTEHNLNARILVEKEDADLPKGTVINQTPLPTQHIKPYQSVFLVVTKKPAHQYAPSCILQSRQAIEKNIQTSGLRYHFYYLTSDYPYNVCIGQSPVEHDPLEQNTLICYLSAGNKKPIVWPDFRNNQLKNIKEVLEHHNLTAHIMSSSITDISLIPDDSIITDQHPKPGSLITFNDKQPMQVQLHVN